MPAGSKVWVKFEASACPDDDGDDCAGSNQAGPNPPNGILLSTFGGGGNSATAFAEILPGRIRLYSSGAFATFMHASYEDTFTVTGTATGTFDIPIEFHVSGVARSVGVNCPGDSCHAMISANGEAEIGTFNPLTTFGGTVLNEGSRVTPFDAQASTSFSFPNAISDTQVSQPIDVTAQHTVQNLRVGDTFTLAFGMNARATRAEFDLLDTGTISFDLPPGVGLTSALERSLIPEPNGLLLGILAMGLGASCPFRRRLN
jgi:hypothetical protein